MADTECCRDCRSDCPCEHHDEVTGSTSDGFHTFDELYHHRTILFTLLTSLLDELGAECWKARVHADGTMFDGFFIAGVTGPSGDATYHLKNEYWDRFPAPYRLKAPEFDGHTPDEALARLWKMIIGTEVPGGSDD